ncbi:MAG: hypothetical protein R2851_07150 [Caldilineaceae bacterium]
MRSLVLGKTILVRTILDKRGDDRSGKFGRLLGELLVEGDDGVLINVNQLLLDEGYAVPFGADGSAVQAAVPVLPGGAACRPPSPAPTVAKCVSLRLTAWSPCAPTASTDRSCWWDSVADG